MRLLATEVRTLLLSARRLSVDVVQTSSLRPQGFDASIVGQREEAGTLNALDRSAIHACYHRSCVRRMLYAGGGDILFGGDAFPAGGRARP